MAEQELYGADGVNADMGFVPLVEKPEQEFFGSGNDGLRDAAGGIIQKPKRSRKHAFC